MIAAFVFLIWFWNSLYVIKEWERGVVLRLGRMQPDAKGAGLRMVFWPIETLYRISLRIETLDVPSQDIITRDNVSVKVNAVCYFRVVDANLALSQVQNYLYATSQLAQTTLRSMVGQFELDEILSEREKVNSRLQVILDQDTEPWGIKVTKVEVKQVDIPERCSAPSRQAEAERERRAKVIHAEGKRGVSEAGGGREYSGKGTGSHSIAVFADADGNWSGEKYDDRLSAADRYFGGVGEVDRPEIIHGNPGERRRRGAGEPAPHRTICADGGDLRRGLHARLFAGTQPVRFQTSRRRRRRWESMRRRIPGGKIQTRPESENARVRGKKFRLGFLPLRRSARAADHLQPAPKSVTARRRPLLRPTGAARRRLSCRKILPARTAR